MIDIYPRGVVLLNRKREQRRARMKKQERQIAFNTHLLLNVVLFAVMLAGAVVTSGDGGTVFETVLCYVFAALFILTILISPLRFIFTGESVTIVYCLGVKERILWSEVREIYSEGSVFGGGGLPRYNVVYPCENKRLFFVNGEITKTKRTGRLLKKFWGKEINATE